MHYEHGEKFIARKRKDDDKNNVDVDQLCFNTNSVGVPTIRDGLGQSVESENTITSERPKISIALPDFVEFTDEELAEIEEIADLPGQTYYSAEEKLGLIENVSADFYKKLDIFERSEQTQEQRDAKIALEALKFYSKSKTTNGQLDCILNGHPMAPAFAGKTAEQLERNADSQREAGDRRMLLVGSNVLKLMGVDIDAVDEDGKKIFKSKENAVGLIHDKYYPEVTTEKIKYERKKLRDALKKVADMK